MELLSQAFERLGADVVCETVPGMAHSRYPAGVDAMYAALFKAWDQALKSEKP